MVFVHKIPIGKILENNYFPQKMFWMSTIILALHYDMGHTILEKICRQSRTDTTTKKVDITVYVLGQ